MDFRTGKEFIREKVCDYIFERVRSIYTSMDPETVERSFLFALVLEKDALEQANAWDEYQNLIRELYISLEKNYDWKGIEAKLRLVVETDESKWMAAIAEHDRLYKKRARKGMEKPSMNAAKKEGEKPCPAGDGDAPQQYEAAPVDLGEDHGLKVVVAEGEKCGLKAPRRLKRKVIYDPPKAGQEDYGLLPPEVANVNISSKEGEQVLKRGRGRPLGSTKAALVARHAAMVVSGAGTTGAAEKVMVCTAGQELSEQKHPKTPKPVRLSLASKRASQHLRAKARVSKSSVQQDEVSAKALQQPAPIVLRPTSQVTAQAAAHDTTKLVQGTAHTSPWTSAKIAQIPAQALPQTTFTYADLDLLLRERNEYARMLQ